MSLSFRIVVVFVLSLSILLKAIKLSAILVDNKVAAFLDRPEKNVVDLKGTFA